MYAKKTNPERLSSMLDVLMSRPVIDKRKKAANRSSNAAGPDRFDDMPPDDDVPF
jgi:hypothetical protein